MPITRIARLDPDGNPVRSDITGLRIYDQAVVCSACGTRAIVPAGSSIFSPDSVDAIGRRIDSIFRYHTTAQRWVSRCRSCERAARNSSPSRARRVATADAVARITNRDRRFGVELECIMPSTMRRATVSSALIRAGLDRWSVKSDGSLRGNGCEVVGPPLSGDDGIEQVRTACRVLKDLGCTVNASCGTHVHHEIRDLDLDGIKRFARTWANNQPMIDGLVSPSRRGANAPTYCGTFRATDAERIENVASLDLLYRAVGDRYKTINFQAFGRYGTVEVRQHQGTLDAEKIVTWIRFAQAMIATCAAAPRPIAAQSSVSSLLSTMRDALDATARTFLLGRAVEFAAVPVTS